jgi:hypothetical protein
MQAVVKEIADLVGLHNALELVTHWGGRELSVPKKMHRMHPIALTLGLEPACKLAENMGGQRLRLPLERNALLEIRNEMIVKEAREGTSITKLGNRYGLTRSAITKILRAFNTQAKNAS